MTCENVHLNIFQGKFNFQGMSEKRSRESAAGVHHILEILHKWGIHTLGQFTSLDKEQIGVRLGPEAVLMWERANGKSERLLKLVRPPESFEESFEFENEIETAEPLLFILRRFLEQLTLRLGTIYLVAKELTLQITFTRKQRYERCFKIPQPTNDVDLLFRMLQTHLENFKSEYPITAVSLEAQPAKPAKEQFGLFETILRNPTQLSETLARLTALFGTDRVGSPVLEETHKPDAFRMEPFVWNSSASTNGTNDPHPTLSQAHSHPLTGASRTASDPDSQDTCGLCPSLPAGERERRTCGSTAVREVVALRRFRPAESAFVFLSENIPTHVQSASVSGKVAEQRGPYLASGNWWDDKSWGRSERDVHLSDGAILRCHESEGTWKVDGVYD
jgi:protein ImuB